mgnify:CR=1 FL=1
MSHRINHLLIIDDDPINNLVCQKKAERSGVVNRITICKNVQDAIAYLTETEQQDPGNMPEVILLDINMPVHSGWDFLEVYREKLDEDTKNRIYISMLTSSLNEEDRIRAHAYQEVKAYNIKPVKEGVFHTISSSLQAYV